MELNSRLGLLLSLIRKALCLDTTVEFFSGFIVLFVSLCLIFRIKNLDILVAVKKETSHNRMMPEASKRVAGG